MIRPTLVLALAAACFLPAFDLAAGERAEFTKISTFALTSDLKDQTAVDPMIRFERKRLLRGAVTLADQLARYGNYFTLTWKAEDRNYPMTVRLEYRQQNTANKVNVLETQVTELKRKNVTEFSVIGDAYETNGRVVAWRATLLRGDRVLASAKSFLWD